MKTNEKSKKIISKVILLGVILIFFALLARFAWAKYMSFTNGNAEADIAQWNFNVTAGSRQDLIIDLAKTRYDEDTNSVDRTTVAPGTSGKIILNINANVTDVSLKYDIDLDIQQIPENLIFYTDSGMENAIYHSNNNIHMDGFFRCNENNKTVQKILYWKWPMETGQTAEQISINDELDSRYIGKNITMAIQVVGSQVKEAPNTEDTQVTFDANGGTIKEYGNSSQMTKNVVTGGQYGELPIPVREGYEFLGWHGKNLYNVNNIPNNEIIRLSNGVSAIDDDWISISTISGQRWYNYWTYNININKGMPYTIIVEIKEATNISGDLFVTSNHQIDDSILTCQFPRNIIASDKLVSNSVIVKRITSSSDVQTNYGLRTFYDNKNLNDNEKIIFRISVLDDQNVTSDNFKYEPYYVQSTTEVAQSTNHTLTAMWAVKK